MPREYFTIDREEHNQSYTIYEWRPGFQRQEGGAGCTRQNPLRVGLGISICDLLVRANTRLWRSAY